MSQNNKIQLEYSSILYVPTQKYPIDFTFIVNGKEFQTSRIVSDLLSPTISQNHLIDPTMDKYIINTINQGNFSDILSLATFNPIYFTDEQLPFIFEVLKILNNDKIHFPSVESKELEKINIIKSLQNIDTPNKTLW